MATLQELQGKISSRFGFAKNRTKYLTKLKRERRLGNIDKEEYSQYKGLYQELREGQQQDAVSKLQQDFIKAPQKTIGITQEKINTFRQDAFPSREVVRDGDKFTANVSGKEYKGVVKTTGQEGRVFAVRSITPQEQRDRAIEMNRNRLSLAQTKPMPNFTDKQMFETVNPLGKYYTYTGTKSIEQIKEEESIKADEDYKFFRIPVSSEYKKDARIKYLTDKEIVEGVKDTGNFFASSGRGLLKTTALVTYESNLNAGVNVEKAPSFVKKFYDYRYKEFPKEDLSNIALLASPHIFKEIKPIVKLSGTKAGKSLLTIGAVAYGGKVTGDFISEPTGKSLAELAKFTAFIPYAEYGESALVTSGKKGKELFELAKDIDFSIGKSGRIGGRPAKVRSGRTSKAEIRRQSFNIIRNQNTFFDTQTGEAGIRVRSPELKDVAFTKERVIRIEPLSKQITQIKDVQLGGRGSLNTRFNDNFSFKGFGSQPGESKLYPRGFGSQRLSIVETKGDTLGVTILQRQKSINLYQKQPKIFLPEKAIPRQIQRNIKVGDNVLVTTGNVFKQEVPLRDLRPQFEFQLEQRGGFRKGFGEKLISRVKDRALELERKNYLSDLSRGYEILPPLERVSKIKQKELVLDVMQEPKLSFKSLNPTSLNFFNMNKEKLNYGLSFDSKVDTAFKFDSKQAQKQDAAFDNLFDTPSALDFSNPRNTQLKKRQPNYFNFTPNDFNFIPKPLPPPPKIKKPKEKIPPPPPLLFPKLKFKQSKSKQQKGSVGKFASYAPSVTAEIFEITGKPFKKGSTLTGFEFRPTTTRKLKVI